MFPSKIKGSRIRIFGGAMVLSKPVLLAKLRLMVHESSLVAHKYVIDPVDWHGTLKKAILLKQLLFIWFLYAVLFHHIQKMERNQMSLCKPCILHVGLEIWWRFSNLGLSPPDNFPVKESFVHFFSVVGTLSHPTIFNFPMYYILCAIDCILSTVSYVYRILYAYIFL